MIEKSIKVCNNQMQITMQYFCTNKDYDQNRFIEKNIYILHFSSAVDTTSGQKVAIKKLARPFQSAVHAKRTYRELRMLKHMNHENVSKHTIEILYIVDFKYIHMYCCLIGDRTVRCISSIFVFGRFSTRVGIHMSIMYD